MKKKLEVLNRIGRYPVIGDAVCAADYTTGCVLEINSSVSVAVNRYFYDDDRNVKSEELLRYSDDEFLYLLVSNSTKSLLKKIRSEVGCSFAIRKEVAAMM